MNSVIKEQNIKTSLQSQRGVVLEEKASCLTQGTAGFKIESSRVYYYHHP